MKHNCEHRDNTGYNVFSWIFFAPVIPVHSESSTAVDSFNRSLKKLVQTATLNQKHIYIFLHSYQNLPHTITQKLPTALFLKWKLKTYLQSWKEYTSPVDDIVRKNQNQKYEGIEEYSEKNQLTFNIGDNAILKWGGIVKKQDSEFYIAAFNFIEIKCTMIMMQSDNGKIYTHHICFS